MPVPAPAPNTYEAPSCQETHVSSERTLYFFPHSSACAVDSRSHVLTEFLDTGAASVWLHQTRIEVLSSLAGRLPKPSVLGDLETSPYPPTGLCKRVAKRVPFASEC